MIWNLEIRAKAIELRKQEKTYPEICAALGEIIPKATLNFWFRGLQMPEDFYSRKKITELERLESSRNRSIEVRRKKMIRRLSGLRYKNRYLLKVINRDIAVLMLSMLYWAEGRKYPSCSGLSFANSDPQMIKLFLALLRTCFEIDESKFRGTVQCRADQDTLKLEKFWRRMSGIRRFYPTRVDQRSLGVPTRKLRYKGVLVINYFDTDLQLELQFLGEYLGSVSKNLALQIH